MSKVVLDEDCMTRVPLDISMSLDGFVTGPKQGRG
jgi:hypothetical protein